MSLTKLLKSKGFDFIDSPMRSHILLQLWRKSVSNPATFYAHHYSDIFKDNGTVINPLKANALDVNATKTNKLQFNLGLSGLKNLLANLNLGNVGIDSKITGGKTISTSFNSAYSIVIPEVELDALFTDTDIKLNSTNLMKHLNSNDILIVSGILYAKELLIEIESDNEITAQTEADIALAVSGKIQVERTGAKSIKMTTTLPDEFPIAIQAHQLAFNKGEFNKAKLITDDKDLF